MFISLKGGRGRTEGVEGERARRGERQTYTLCTNATREEEEEGEGDWEKVGLRGLSSSSFSSHSKVECK